MITRALKRGYTAIEVLIAMTVLAIGASGVISMQRGAIQGNVDARRMDTANAIAHDWAERLRQDAMLWNLRDRLNVSAADNRTTTAPLLATVDGNWHIPTGRLADSRVKSPGFDVLGNDLPQAQLGGASLMFCANVRLTWLVTDKLMRAEVRVFWPRGVNTAPAAGVCTADPTFGDPGATELDQYHFVYAVTAVRKNEAQ